MNTVRIGMIRCDLHAYWYAALFAAHDPIRFRDAQPGLHWLFYGGYWDRPEELKAPTVSGLELSKLWDVDRKAAEEMATVFNGGPVVCDSIEELCTDVDLVFVADCYTAGDDHLQLASPSLERGIPTFVDKPLSSSLQDARMMVELAEKHKAPLMSTSLLRMSPHADRFRSRFAEIAPVVQGVVRGAVGKEGNLAGIFHTLSLAQGLFGDGVEHVQCMGTRPFEYLHLHYPNAGGEPFDVLAMNNYVVARHIYCGFRCDVYGQTGVIHSPFVDDFLFPHAGIRTLEGLKSMATTGTAPVSSTSMLEFMAIVEAGRRAQAEGRQVYLSSVQ